MPTFHIHSDAYRLIRVAHRLSYATIQAIDAAEQDVLYGLWKIDCSAAIARELWTWFHDCEQHSALVPRDSWKVRVSQRAKQRIARAR